MHMRTPKETDHKAIQDGILWRNIKLMLLKELYLPLRWFRKYFLTRKLGQTEGSRTSQLTTNEPMTVPTISSTKQYLTLYLKRTRLFRSFDGQRLPRKSDVLLLPSPTSWFDHQGSWDHFNLFWTFNRLTCLCFPSR